jgi:hypothetical protein
MAKFVNTTNVPETLRDGEYVIDMPTFIPEVRAAAARSNDRRRLTHGSLLRTVAQNIANSYDQDFNVIGKLKVHDFEGREFASDEDLSKIVLELLERDYPVIFDKYLDHQVKKRPNGTKLIYFTGPHTKTAVFTNNGIDRIEEKDVDTYLGLKPKKVVGRPAVSNDE